jgi:hypothetical protein
MGTLTLHCVATNTHMHFILLGLSHDNFDRTCCENLLVTLQISVAFKRSNLINLRISNSDQEPNPYKKGSSIDNKLVGQLLELTDIAYTKDASDSYNW